MKLTLRPQAGGLPLVAAVLMLGSALACCACLASARSFAADPAVLRRPYLQRMTPTSVLVVWTTAKEGESEVRYSSSGGVLRHANATSELFTEAAIGGQVAASYYVHVASLAGLQPETPYTYRAYTAGDAMTTRDGSFRTPAVATGQVSILAFGDSGNGSGNQLAIRDVMGRHRFDLALHTGDLAYMYGTYREFDTYHFDVYSALMSGTPLYPVLGNHDYLSLDGRPYLDAFYLPENAPAGREERYYSFDYGPVHIVALDSDILSGYEGGVGADTEMLDWLRADLAATSLSWTIAVMHKPPYGSSNIPVDVGLARIAPVFEEGGVDLVLTGHDHLYERTLPLRGGAPSLIGDGGITYVVTGGAGGGKHLCDPRPYTRSCLRVYHFLHLTVQNNCTLTFDVRGFNNELHEHVVINRCDPDSDTDGASDAAELAAGTNPLDAASTPPPTTPTPVPTITPTPSGPRGDANCDGVVNSVDSALVLQRSAGLVPSLPCEGLADADRGGHISAVDAALILQLVAGLLAHLP